MTRPAAAFAHTRRFRILLIGAGGNGSEIFDGLTKIHGGLMALDHPGLDVTVMDDDAVALHNTVRQRFWPHEVGINKSIAVVHRANMLLGTAWRAVPGRFSENELHNVAQYHLVITAVDNLATRRLIANAFGHDDDRYETNTLWLDMGVDRKQAQVVLGACGHNSLGDELPNVVAHFPALLSLSETHSAPSCSAVDSLARQDLFINEAVAGAASQLLWQCFRRGTIPWNGAVIDLDTGFQQVIPFISQAHV